MRRFLIILGITLAIGLNALGANAETPYRIGMTLGLTGKYATLADLQMKGYKLWEQDVNSKGGILGRPVQLTVLDDKSDPATARELIARR